MFENYKAKTVVTLHPETISKFDKVERYGYVPQAVRIRQMLEAGDNLAAIRTEMCDFPPDAEIDWSMNPDPILSRSFDNFQEMETLKMMRERYNKLIETQKRLSIIKELVDEGIITPGQADKEAAKVVSDEPKTEKKVEKVD